ncbi:glutathione S-transferase [Mycolicibacterium litorale]|nr:glutathione S-transferase [Mycolicibacterium litorale]
MYPNPKFLLHLCGRRDWDDARVVGELCPASLAEVGFVHLSTPEQVHLPANRLFAGRSDLVSLHIDPRALHAPVLWEPGLPTDPESMLFPHLYGPLPVSAVIGVTAYQPGEDGSFPPYQSPT